jgi:hypothetical protein
MLASFLVNMEQSKAFDQIYIKHGIEEDSISKSMEAF